MRRFSTLIFGGTFDPIHIGHLFIAEEACQVFGVKKLIFMPTHQNPLKMQIPGATAEQRLEMVARATANIEEFEVSDIECKQTKPSFTIDTLRTLYKDGAIDAQSGMIIGSEILSSLPDWQSFQELSKIITFIIAQRDHSVITNLPFTYSVLNNPILNISSSDIRKRISKSQAYRYLLPMEAYHYIKKEKLYINGT